MDYFYNLPSQRRMLKVLHYEKIYHTAISVSGQYESNPAL